MHGRYLIASILAGVRLFAQVEAGFHVRVDTYSAPGVIGVGYEVPAGENLAFYTGWEYGDDVQLAAGSGVIANLRFDYFSNYSKTDGWTFRLYELDLGSGRPGAQIYSRSGDLLAGGALATIHFAYDVGNILPAKFFYTVQFSGIGDGNVSGLIVPNRLATTGSSAPGFLIHTAEEWMETSFTGDGIGSGDLAILSPPIAPPAPTPLGQSVVLSVGAVGHGPLVFQWRRNGVVMPGETKAQLSLGALRAEHAGYYEVAVTDGTGVVFSEPVRIEPALPDLPFADSFTAAVTGGASLIGLSGVGQGVNFDATAEKGEPAHGPLPAQGSLWLTWRPDVDGIATFSTLGSDFDTVLAVYERAPFGAKGFAGLIRVAANDEAGDPSHSSRVDFNVETGHTYLLALDGNGSLGRGGRGHAVLSWSVAITGERLPRNSQSPPAVEVAPGAPVNLTTVVESPAGAIVTIRWFRVVPGGVEFTGSVGPSIDLLAVNEGSVGRYFAEATVTYPGGSVRTVVVGNFDVQLRLGDNEGDEVIAWDTFALSRANSPQRIVQPARQKLQRAGLARGTSGTQIFSSVGSTREDGEPAACGVVGAATSWYALQAEADGAITVDTAGSNFDTVLAVYTDTGEGPGLFDGLRPVVCNNDASATVKTSAVEFCGKAGTVYFVQVDGVAGAVGIVKLNFAMRNDPPGTVCGVEDDSCRQRAGLHYAPPGGQLTLAPEILNQPPFSVEWLRNGQVIEGAKSEVLVLDSPKAGDYQLRLTSRFGRSERPVGAVRILDAGEIAMGVDFLCDGRMRLLPTGAPGQSLIIERSADLVTWTPVGTNAPPTGVGEYLVTASEQASSTVFRLRSSDIRIGIFRLPDGRLRLQSIGAPNQRLVIERSTDLEAWTPISTNAPPSGVAELVLPVPDQVGPAAFRVRAN